ncbi:adenylate kinase family protein [Protaetiibacter mangrovi]|uniref:Adenylate kinase n=1 Tax=Protaetiibacter mangrovi TaxID=2970926 RepID=A0ABT1ZGF7_9MICO|nr:nucleoside monophosphate kinase [Protaetiibacter mangrovi]MCS0499794.1 nucleoside monophosphate kinase [Protaetiibacter mangrovi]TPX03429.1 nucleoside monophosphate kinase [Schumannella luteola]
MRIVLVGPPGAGKGTQGALVAERLGVPQIVVGELLRTHIASGTALGERAREFVERGELVPDHLVVGIVEQAVEPHLDGFVLDGFPRSIAQARMLDRFLRARAAELDVALHFEVPDEVLADRMDARGRADDVPEVAATRIAGFRQSEEALLEHYRGRVVELDAVGAVDVVFDRILDGLREALLAA